MWAGTLSVRDLSHDWTEVSSITARSRCGGVEALIRKVTEAESVTCPGCLGREAKVLCAVPLGSLKPLDGFMLDICDGVLLGCVERVSPAGGYVTVLYRPPGGGRHREFDPIYGDTVEFVDSGVRRSEWSAGTLVRPLVEDEMSEVNVPIVSAPGGPAPSKADIRAKVEALKAKAASKIAAAPAKGKPKLVPAKAKAPAAKAPREQKPCRCACGTLTGGTFAPGHDARFYGWLKKISAGNMDFKELPKSLQKEFVDVKGVKKALAVSGH